MVKRLFDILCSLAAALLLAPVLIAIMIAVSSGSPGGAFFRQTRVGRKGRHFQLLKFRTMRPGSEALGQITVGERDPRITGVGHVLRRTKLDELPQLFNILWGDMSIVGPRPEVPRYVALYSEEQKAVLNIRPGLTSLASIAYINENEVLGRSNDPERTYIEDVMPAKLALDLQYVKDQSLWVDLQIIMATLQRILGR